jgi:hypothetical protein
VVRHVQRSPQESSFLVLFDVVVEQDEAGLYVSFVPALPGCHSWTGTTVEAPEAAYTKLADPPEKHGMAAFYGQTPQ